MANNPFFMAERVVMGTPARTQAWIYDCQNVGLGCHQYRQYILVCIDFVCLFIWIDFPHKQK